MAEILDPNENKIKMTPRPHVKLEVACLTSLPPVSINLLEKDMIF